MTASQWGLILNILGTILIFFFGFPSKIQEDKSAGSISFGNLSEEDDKKRILRNKRIKWGAYFSLGLLVAGFLLQFIGSFKSS